MKLRITAAGVLFLIFFGQDLLRPEDRSLSIVTTTTDMGYFVGQIAGDRARVHSLIRGFDDPHHIEARPDFILKASKADGFVQVGLDLEVGWSPVLIQQSRNARIRIGAPGNCDASLGVRILEKPESTVDRSMGDVHVFGNPHYHTDPLNAAISSRNIRDMLVRIDPEGSAIYKDKYNRFQQNLKNLAISESRKFVPYRGLKVAVYHREFVYYNNRFGIQEIGSIEEKPGVPPGAAYLESITRKLKKEDVKIILLAPWNERKAASRVAVELGALIVQMPVSVGSEAGIDSYERLIETMGKRLRDAADQTGWRKR
ncbi:MAG: metal ABC transporter substrate-binding protein [Spirochaetia bacterium]|nr:metal ABC transporter substrate-binding protein [Spirochaetia bacterium]